MLPRGLLPNSGEAGSEACPTGVRGDRRRATDADRVDPVGWRPLLGGAEAGPWPGRLAQGEFAHVVGGRGQQRLDAHPVAAAEPRAPQPAPLLAVAEDRLHPGLASADALPRPEGAQVGDRAVAQAAVVGAEHRAGPGRRAADRLVRAGGARAGPGAVDGPAVGAAGGRPALPPQPDARGAVDDFARS